MAKLNDNQKLGVIIGAAVLLAGGGGGGVWWAKGLVEEKETEIAQMRTEIEAAEAKIAKIKRVEQDVIILRENLNEYVKILPEETELNEFVRIVQQFSQQSGVKLKTLGAGQQRRAKGSAFEAVSYSFDVDATLWQFIHFVNLFESHERFVHVKAFQLTANQPRQIGQIEDVEHSIKMTVETYAYKPGNSGGDVSIANYDAKVERLREEIFEARQTLSVAGYRFQGPRGRRDIFIDPRETAGGRDGLPTGPSPRDQRRIIDLMRAKISEAEVMQRRLGDKSLTIFEIYALKRELEESLGKVRREVEEYNTKGFISHAPLKLAWAREVVEPLGRLEEGLSDTGGPANQWLAKEDMESLLGAMNEDLAAGNLIGAIERHDIVEERIGVPVDDPRYEIFLRIESLYMRAKLAQEFAGLSLDISGICVNDGGKSGLVLNGTVYEEGEYIDNNLLVKQVGRDRVEFVYKGFTIVKLL